MMAMKPYASRRFETDAVGYWIGQQDPKNVYLEIGSFRGGSLDAFGRCMSPGATLIAVDAPMPAENGGVKLLETAGGLCDDGYVAHVVLGGSEHASTQAAVKEHLAGRSVDVLLIDGRHTTPAATLDVANYVPLVRPGGLVIFHDVGPCVWEPTRSQGFIDALFPVWRKLAARHGRKMVVQAHCGYGLVWLNG